MKSILAAVLCVIVFLPRTLSAGETFSKTDCSFKGKKLFGKIQVVTSFPDVKVQIVTSFPDVKVKVVSAFADKCGMWQMVDSFPNTKVQFVDSFPDVKVQYVESFPGVR